MNKRTMPEAVLSYARHYGGVEAPQSRPGMLQGAPRGHGTGVDGSNRGRPRLITPLTDQRGCPSHPGVPAAFHAQKAEQAQGAE